VVVDGATDDHGERGLCAGRPDGGARHELGKGDAMRVGFAIARLMRPEIVVTLDSDGQYKPEEIEDVMRPVVDGKADFVIVVALTRLTTRSRALRHAGSGRFLS
jgi:glycosyltransferase involved in cell wall biosynthesis